MTREEIRKALLEDALRFYLEFLQQQGSDPGIQFGAALAWQRVGELRTLLGDSVGSEPAYRESIALLEKLVEAEPSNLLYRQKLTYSSRSLGALLVWELNKAEEAEVILRRSLGLQEKLAAEYRDGTA